MGTLHPRTLYRYLAPIADEAKVERLAESLRITTNGLCYLAVQYPDLWSRERLAAAIDDQLGRLGLSSALPERDAIRKPRR